MIVHYRFHTRGAAALVALELLCAAAAWAWLPEPWRAAAVVPLLGAAAAVVQAIASRDEARRLGAVVVEEDGIRRVRADGRVVAALRWGDLRSVVVDRRVGHLMLQGRDGSVWCRGPGLLGGVGLERFEDVVEAVCTRSQAPVREPAGRGSRRRTAPVGSRRGARSPA